MSIQKGGSMRKVFTLVELIVVIAIIAILGAVIAPKLSRLSKKRVSRRLSAT
jgi:prepilin-type N-terminal cleavage/methylation domain-containing protein